MMYSLYICTFLHVNVLLECHELIRWEARRAQAAAERVEKEAEASTGGAKVVEQFTCCDVNQM